MVKPFTLISAGAGSGKTRRLKDDIVKAIVEDGMAPENILATTFTVKAANEILERVRRSLLEKGKYDEATRIMDGYIGTMNSVFGRLVIEFSLDMGLSPRQTVLSAPQAERMFSSFTSKIINDYQQKHHDLLSRFQEESLPEKVYGIITTARQNHLSPEEIRRSGIKSWEKFEQTLGDEVISYHATSELLIKELRNSEGMIVDKKELGKIKSVLQNYEQGKLLWSDWDKIIKLKNNKKNKEYVDFIRKTATQHIRSDQFRRDYQTMIEIVFDCASEALESYQNQKKLRGLIDFTDQEAYAIDLLTNPEFKEALSERISAVFIDEVQDSSPLQIALCQHLMNIANKSEWVGDSKQAIYGFRGSDPALVEQVKSAIESDGQSQIKDILSNSYRSRPGLVSFVNNIFLKTFKDVGMTKEEVVLNPDREDYINLKDPLEFWTFEKAENKAEEAEYIAYKIREILDNTEDYLIEDDQTKDMRPIQAGDMAVLCRSNSEVAEIADALTKKGIPVSTAGPGLKEQPEIVYTKAFLTRILDGYDSLALAKLIHLANDSEKKSEWLNKWLDSENPADAFNHIPGLRNGDPNGYREQMKHYSPSEALDKAIALSGVEDLIKAWGNTHHRQANVVKLRKLATAYEDESRQWGIGATTAGFLQYLDDINEAADENKVAESGDDVAVSVTNYHKSKGLEWPFVMMLSLNGNEEKKLNKKVFDEFIALQTGQIKIQNPLQNRRIHYWPWPYHTRSNGESLVNQVKNHRDIQEMKKKNLDESNRLLYVGMTRARDYLILAAKDITETNWIRQVSDVKPSFDNKHIVIGDFELPIEKIDKGIQKIVSEMDTGEDIHQPIGGVNEQITEFIPAKIQPSQYTFTEDKAIGGDKTLYGNLIEINSRINLKGKQEMSEVGDMLHNFLAVDNQSLQETERIQLAQNIQTRYKLSVTTPVEMVGASNALHNFIRERYPSVLDQWKEYPIHIREGLQTATGWIDQLLLTKEGWIIIDHKSFPGRASRRLKEANDYLPQLHLYAKALETASGKQVSRAIIHFVVGGSLVLFSRNELKLDECFEEITIKKEGVNNEENDIDGEEVIIKESENDSTGNKIKAIDLKQAILELLLIREQQGQYEMAVKSIYQEVADYFNISESERQAKGKGGDKLWQARVRSATGDLYHEDKIDSDYAGIYYLNNTGRRFIESILNYRNRGGKNGRTE